MRSYLKQNTYIHTYVNTYKQWRKEKWDRQFQNGQSNHHFQILQKSRNTEELWAALTCSRGLSWRILWISEGRVQGLTTVSSLSYSMYPCSTGGGTPTAPWLFVCCRLQHEVLEPLKEKWNTQELTNSFKYVLIVTLLLRPNQVSLPKIQSTGLATVWYKHRFLPPLLMWK